MYFHVNAGIRNLYDFTTFFFSPKMIAQSVRFHIYHKLGFDCFTIPCRCQEGLYIYHLLVMQTEFIFPTKSELMGNYFRQWATIILEKLTF